MSGGNSRNTLRLERKLLDETDRGTTWGGTQVSVTLLVSCQVTGHLGPEGPEAKAPKTQRHS